MSTNQSIKFPFKDVSNQILTAGRMQLAYNNSKMAILVADNTTYGVRINLHQQKPTEQNTKLLCDGDCGKNMSKQDQISTQNSALAEDTQDRQKTVVAMQSVMKCLLRTEKFISLTASDIDSFFQSVWENLNKSDGPQSPLCQSSSTVLEHEIEESTLLPRATDILYYYLKARNVESQHWANQFLLLVGRNLDCIYKNRNFLCLDLDVVSDILGSSYLGVTSEKVVFDAGLRWIRADLDKRFQHASVLLSYARYGLMKPEEIIQCVFSFRPITAIFLDIPPYPQSVLNGTISRYLAELNMISSNSAFHIRQRVKIEDCSPAKNSMDSHTTTSIGAIINVSSESCESLFATTSQNMP